MFFWMLRFGVGVPVGVWTGQSHAKVCRKRNSWCAASPKEVPPQIHGMVTPDERKSVSHPQVG